MWIVSSSLEGRDCMSGAVGWLLQTIWAGGVESLNQGGEGKD